MSIFLDLATRRVVISGWIIKYYVSSPAADAIFTVYEKKQLFTMITI